MAADEAVASVVGDGEAPADPDVVGAGVLVEGALVTALAVPEDDAAGGVDAAPPPCCIRRRPRERGRALPGAPGLLGPRAYAHHR